MPVKLTGAEIVTRRGGRDAATGPVGRSRPPGPSGAPGLQGVHQRPALRWVLKKGPGVDGDDAEDLLRRCASGDARAWAEVVDRYGRLVYSVPKRYRFPDADCDDIFQTVFTTLLKSLGQIKDARTLPAWLLTTTHRACWRRTRASKEAGGVREAPLLDEAPPEASLSRWERQHAVHDALRELGGVCEKLLRVLFLTASTPGYEVVAEHTGLAPGSIGPMRRRCLKKLAVILESSGSLEGFNGPDAQQTA